MVKNNANVLVKKSSESNLVFPELSHKIVGSAFKVFNSLGWGLREKEYSIALVKELQSVGVLAEKEVFIPLEYKDERLSHYFADIIVESKILLELKVVSRLGYVHVRQVLKYLRARNLKLGILLYLTKDGVKYRRVLNSKL